MTKSPTLSKRDTKNFIKKNVSVIHINAKLTLVQRKIVNALLFNAYERLLTNDTHSINVSILSEMIGFDSKNVAHLKDALKGMVETSVEWDVLEDDGVQSWEVSSLLSSAKISAGICSYRYDKSLAEKLFHPDIYSKINLSVVKHMKSSYALILYENCYRFIGTGNTGWWDLQTFRKIMGVDDGSYTEFKFLNRDIIKPAIVEVNKLSNITLDYETSRKGRSVTGIRFSVKPNAQLSLLEMEEEDEISETIAFKELLKLKVSKTLARSWIIEFGEDYVLDKVEYTKTQAASGRIKSSKSGFLKAAVENDYVSEKEASKDLKQASDERVAKKELLERQISTNEGIWRGIEREHRRRTVEVIQGMFSELTKDEQENRLESLHQTLSSIQLADFKKKSWASLLAYSGIREYWEQFQPPSPSLQQIAEEKGIDDVEAFHASILGWKEQLENL